ncbi:alpha/beta hydrolase [Nanoarchaeota archaeon]
MRKWIVILFILMAILLIAGKCEGRDRQNTTEPVNLTPKDPPHITPEDPGEISTIPNGCSSKTDYIECKDIEYKSISGVDEDLLSLDVYMPKSDGEYPVIVYIHGGGWNKGDKGLIYSKDEHFTSKGYVFVSINYRLTEEKRGKHNGVMYPMHNEDAASAIKWVNDNIEDYRGNDNLILMGHSAGGGIMAAIAVDSKYLNAEGMSLSDIDCAISIDASGFDINERLDNCFLAAQCDVFTNAFGEDKDIWTEASPINKISSSVPDFFVATTGGMRLDYTQAFVDELDEHNVNNEMKVLSQYGHITIDSKLGKSGETITTEVQKFLDDSCIW